MLPFRIIRSGVLLAGLVATLGTPLPAAEDGFTATLSVAEKSAAGLAALSTDELAALDRLVAEDAARDRQRRTPALDGGSFAGRQPAAARREAGLGGLTPVQLAKLDELVATASTPRPQPKERPRLKDNEVVSLKSRLEVHGGISFTYGTGGGGSFREGAAWVTYYDPVTGLGLGFGFSQFSGDGFYRYYPGYYYSGATYAGAAQDGFSLDGASRRGAAGWARPGSGFRH